MAANAAGLVVEPGTGALYGELSQGRVSYPAQDVHRAARLRLAEFAAKNAPPPLDTTLAVVATDAAVEGAGRSRPARRTTASHAPCGQCIC